MTDSHQLLAGYVGNGSEEAFRELVARYLDLVYSTAIRLVGGDTHLAEDVAQTVFVDLARQARTLPCDVMLGGWLHRDTCFVASKLMRSERRRQSRERQVVEMNSLPDHSEANLAHLAPILDEAINQLGAVDRVAILLRFFEQRDLRSVGEALGSSENAAQKRVARALEELRVRLRRRGVALSASALGTALASEAVAAAPAGLAVSISSAAMASVAAGTGTTLTFLMANTKLQAGIISAVVILGLGTSVVIQQQARARMREQDESLRHQGQHLGRIAADNERLSNRVAQADGAAANGQLSELLELRSEAELLRGQTRELARPQGENRRLQQPPPREAKTPMQLRELVWAKQRYAEAWMSAFIAFARENQGQLPATFEQAKPYWPREIKTGTGAAADQFENLYGVMADQFEILYHGSLDSLTNLDVIVFREKKSWPHETGKWGRFYALANGGIQYCSSSDKTANGNFDNYERAHTASPTVR